MQALERRSETFERKVDSKKGSTLECIGVWLLKKRALSFTRELSVTTAAKGHVFPMMDGSLVESFTDLLLVLSEAIAKQNRRRWVRGKMIARMYAIGI